MTSPDTVNEQSFLDNEKSDIRLKHLNLLLDLFINEKVIHPGCFLQKDAASQQNNASVFVFYVFPGLLSLTKSISATFFEADFAKVVDRFAIYVRESSKVREF